MTFDNISAYRGLLFLGLNIRSLLPKLSEVKLLVLKTNASVLCLSETWLDHSITDSEISIPSYSIVRKDRDRHGGGVCLYIKSNLPYNCRPDLDREDLEMIWVELLLNKTKPILISSTYRPPTQANFIDHFDEILSTMDTSLETYILGDMNICMKGLDSPYLRHYNQTIQAYSLKQLITDPTRVTAECSSIIDHILSNTNEKVKNRGVLPLGISDHFLTYCIRKTTKQKFNCHNTVTLRSMKNYNKSQLSDKLNAIDWSLVYSCSSPNDACSMFYANLTPVINDIAPLKTVRIKQSTEPWMDSNILAKINQRNSLLRSFNETKDPTVKADFNRLRNTIQRDIASAKETYLQSQLTENIGNPRQLWKKLKTLGYSDKLKGRSKMVLKIGDNLCYEENSIANHVNTFFTNVANELVNKLPAPLEIYTTNSDNFKQLYTRKQITPGLMELSPTTKEFVLKELQATNPNKSTGLDCVPPVILRDGADTIAPPLTYLINLSIQNSVVPDLFKQARVTPVHKKNSKLDISNYRPISVLTRSSHILEKCVLVQIQKHLVNYNAIYEFQSGFRAGFSTETCLIHMTDYIRSHISNGRYVGALMLDVQKAFDSVNHKILCAKLQAIGVNPAWFESYLSDRKQTTVISGAYSEPMTVNSGVPQGSLLGPLLYLVYSNDMKLAVKNKLLLYADDSVILAAGHTPEEVARELQGDLHSCSQWFIDNKLSLHVGKTECILFGTKAKLARVNNFHVTFGTTTIHSKQQIKYLGVILDQHLSGEHMANHAISKISNKLKFLYRQKKFISQVIRRDLCVALLQCHFDYCCMAWYPALTEKTKHKFQTAQNRIVRYILNLPSRSHIGKTQLRAYLGLNVDSKVKQIRLNHVFKISHKMCPSYLSENFKTVGLLHSFATRSSSVNYHVPHINGSEDRTFFYTGIKEWNSLPNYLKNIMNYDCFKKKCKQYLINLI